MSDALAEAWGRVAELARELYGEDAARDDGRRTLTLARGSARVQATVAPSDAGPVVAIYSTLVTGVGSSQELLAYLLEKNYELIHGAFAYRESAGVLFRNVLLADGLDKQRLRDGFQAVIDAADRYDDEIVERFGGKRSTDQGA